jgi:hypothetical protein
LAVPDQQFQDILEQIEKSVTETIQKQLAQLTKTAMQSGQTPTPQPATPTPAQDTKALREEIMEDVKLEFLTFKQELLQMMAGNQSQTQQVSQPQPTALQPHDLINNPSLIPPVCPEPYPEGFLNVGAQMTWLKKWDRWYKTDNTLKRKYARH